MNFKSSIQRIFFLIAFLVFVFNEASIYSWAEFFVSHQATPHAEYGIRSAIWWSSISLGVMLGIVVSSVTELSISKLGFFKSRWPEFFLFITSVLYIFMFKPIPLLT